MSKEKPIDKLNDGINYDVYELLFSSKFIINQKSRTVLAYSSETEISKSKTKHLYQ